MKKIREFMNNHPIWFSGIMFGLLSIVLNIVWFAFTGMMHIYDIIHVIPTVLIYDPIIKAMGGLVTTEFIFLPLAVIMDFLMGMLFTLIVRKITKGKNNLLIMRIGFAVYWIIITFQWLPII